MKNIFVQIVVALAICLTGTVSVQSQNVTLDFGGDIHGEPGDKITVSVKSSDLTGLNIGNFDFEIGFDSELIDISAPDITRGSLIPPGSGFFNGNVTQDNRILAVFAGANDISGSGELFRFTITLKKRGFNPQGLRVTKVLLGDPNNPPAIEPSIPHDIAVMSGQPSDAIFLNIPDSEGTRNQNITIPVGTSDLGPLNVASYDLDITFDDEIIEVTNVASAGTVSEDGNVVFSQPEPGLLRINTAFSEAPGNGDRLLNLEVKLLGQAQSSPVDFSSTLFQNMSGEQLSVISSSGILNVSDNVPPEFVSILKDTTVFEGESFTFQYEAFDLNDDQLSFTLIDAPEGAAIDAETGLFTWTPVPNQSGSHTITAVVTDLAGATDETSATVTVSVFTMVQFIHNAADPAANGVDIYVDGELLYDNLQFRQARPYTRIPAQIELSLEVYPHDADPDKTSPAFSKESLLLEPNRNYAIIASGLMDTYREFAANPEGLPTSFELNIIEGAPVDAAEGDIRFAIWHGVTDAPSMDVWVDGGPVLANGLVYATSTSNLSVEAGTYPLLLGPSGSAGGNNAMLRFEADFSGGNGLGAIVLASGFLNPEDNEDGEGLDLLLALPDGTTVLVTGVPTRLEQSADLPAGFRLEQNYPNPFNPSTNIVFSIPEQAHVSIDIYSINGQKIMTLINEIRQPGHHEVTLDGSLLSSGIYLYRMTAGEFSQTRKMMLVK